MIFCVEDDNGIRELVLYTLRASGFAAEGFDRGRTMLEALNTEEPSLILLDIMLPDMDGIEILKHLRSNPATRKIPVIVASAKGTEYDRVLGLDLGADDYLCKPFGMMEMVSRIRAVLRRTSGRDSRNALRLGGLSLDMDSHRVYADGEEVLLTRKEYDLLRLFMKTPGRVYSREQLLELIWGTDFLGETRTVDVHIGTLRTKLGPWGGCIRTVRGVGYRMEENR